MVGLCAMAELPPRCETIPDLVAMGLVGFSRPGEMDAEVHFFDDELPASEEFIFCEGFATDAQGRRYCWEIWTVEEYERCSTGPRNEIARGEVAGEPACSIRIVEIDDDVVTWRQVLVEQATFTADFVERLRRAPAAQRGWFFAEMPPDDESDGEDD